MFELPANHEPVAPASPWLSSESEGTLWGFMAGAPVALVAADDSRHLVRVNDHWCDLLGYDLATARAMKIDDFLAPESRPGIDMRWGDLMQTGLATARIVALHADGARIPIRYGAFANILPGVHVAAMLPEPGVHNRMARPTRARRAGQLTRREQESLRLVAVGMTTIAAAEQLGISPETVRTHVRNAMNKLGARTRAQAIAVAMRDGEIPA